MTHNIWVTPRTVYFSMMTVYFQIRPYIFNKGPYIFRKDRIFSTKDRIFSAEDRIFSVRTVYFQARTVYFPAGPYILLGPYIFKDRIFYFSGPYILLYNPLSQSDECTESIWKPNWLKYSKFLNLGRWEIGEFLINWTSLNQFWTSQAHHFDRQ